jgi:hypothetical protein
LEKLKILDLDGDVVTVQLDVKTAQMLAIKLPHLENLHINGCSGLTNLSFAVLLRHLKQLKYVHMKICDRFPSKFLECIRSYGKNLKNIFITNDNLNDLVVDEKIVRTKLRKFKGLEFRCNDLAIVI